ncbi:MAG: hypothetical protein WCH21_03665, partial [Bacteroidota bacterium]
VQPRSIEDVHQIQQGFAEKITLDTVFKILIIVKNGETVTNKNDSGIVIQIAKSDKFHYPYVWNFSRFKKFIA